MKLRFALPALIVSLIGCTASSMDSAHFATGTWRTFPVPSGGQIALTIRQSGDSLSGEDHELGVMGIPAGSGTVSGHYADGVYTLQVAYAAGGVATYVAHLLAADTLSGLWTTPGSQTAGPLKFYRQPD